MCTCILSCVWHVHGPVAAQVGRLYAESFSRLLGPAQVLLCASLFWGDAEALIAS